MIVCENSGHMIADDFPEVRKIVSAGATSKPVETASTFVMFVISLHRMAIHANAMAA